MPRESKPRTRSSSKPAKPSKPAGRNRSPKPGPAKKPESPVISKRDERGTPYPGDWNNPLDGLTRGCF